MQQRSWNQAPLADECISAWLNGLWTVLAGLQRLSSLAAMMLVDSERVSQDMCLATSLTAEYLCLTGRQPGPQAWKS